MTQCHLQIDAAPMDAEPAVGTWACWFAGPFHAIAWLLLVNLAAAFYSANVLSGDWPQILGPQRDGVAAGEQLHSKWSSTGPRVIWKSSVGGGFAGVAVKGDQVISFVREGNQEVARCLNTQSGQQVWEAAAACSYQGGVSSDKGPRCVPLIADDFVITLGVEGRLRCLSLSDGHELWQRDTFKEFRPLEGYFGVGSTPLVHEGRVIVNVGGRENSSVVALDLKTGKTLWTTFQDHASYSSPIVISTDRKPVVVVVTRLNVVGISPESGEVLFSEPFGARGPTVNGANPVALGNKVLLTASYNVGSLLISVSGSNAQELWRDEELLASQYATPVRLSAEGSVVMAVDGRQDAGRESAVLKCIDIEQRKIVWQESGFDYGTLIRVNEEFLLLTCGGELIRFAGSTAGYSELSRHSVLQPTDSGYRLPALSQGRLFIRDDTTLKCLDVGPVP